VTRWLVRVLVASIGSVGMAQAGATEDAGDFTYHAAVGPAIYVAPYFPGARDTRQVLFPFVDAEIDNGATQTVHAGRVDRLQIQ
jgi:hypothetical protein